MIGNLKEREKEILRCLYEEDASSVSELSKALNVSVVTIRSDLEKLEEKGFAVKMRGGAQPIFNRSLIDRINSRRKKLKRNATKARI